jgi:histidine triad (HIT) family protein
MPERDFPYFWLLKAAKVEPEPDQNLSCLRDFHFYRESPVYTEHAMSCVFCNIVEGRIPSTAVYQDDLVYAFADMRPQAPVHLLLVPREHIASIDEADESKRALLGHLLLTAAQLAGKKGLSQGYRVVVNTGDNGGQTVDHLHLHLLGGRVMTWPPG